MLSFFPLPYPDELLYSLLARYQIRSGDTSPKRIQQELFSSSTVIAVADLPSHLNALVAKLPSDFGWSAEHFIQNHTLFPYYQPFLSRDRAHRIQASMKADNGGNIHTRAGIMASSVKTPQFLRFCPDCLQDDLSQYGESYWHRLHQIPGVLLCPAHGQPLQDSLIPVNGMNRHEYFPANSENCPISPVNTSYSATTVEKLVGIAQNAAWLLEHDLGGRDLSWFREKYQTLLIERGLATASGRVHQNQLHDAFLFYYGREVLAVLDSSIDHQNGDSWLSAMARAPRKVFHPLRHLLMIDFLTDSIEEFFHAEQRYAPFGEAPWLCLNAAAQHYQQPVITDLSISYSNDLKKPVGTFRCSCGMVYSRSGPEESEADRYRIGKIIAYGDVWEQKLRELVEVKRMGLRPTARALNVDPNTVKRYASQLNLETSWQPYRKKPSKKVDIETPQLEQQRQIWLDLQQQYPDTSKTTLRGMAPATYAWLYRNDREWLNEHSPALRQPISNANRVDWHQRDLQLLEQVKEARETLFNAAEPVRITVSRIGRTIGKLALLEQHLDQMPLTQAYLASVVETVEAFQIRRVRSAIAQLAMENEEVQEWRVLRLAGLGDHVSSGVRKIIEQESNIDH